MNAMKLREELLEAFAKMDARYQARSEERGARSENSQPSTELPFEPDPQHSTIFASQLTPAPAPSTLNPRPSTMLTDPVLIAAFVNKYPLATSIKVVRATLWERGRHGTRTLPIEVWISLPNGTVVIEKRRTTDELLAIAEAR